MRSQILDLRSNFHFRSLELLVLQQVGVGVSFVWRQFRAKLPTTLQTAWLTSPNRYRTLSLFNSSCGTIACIFSNNGASITDGMSGYTFLAISLNTAIVISFCFVVVVVVELRLPSSIGSAWEDMLVVRLS